jgi:hypothetical protein
MRAQSVPGQANRQRAEERFKSAKKADAKTPKAADTLRQAEAVKTARLRALRLAKEAADKEIANRAAAAARALRAAPRRRVPRPQASSPSEPR